MGKKQMKQQETISETPTAPIQAENTEESIPFLARPSDTDDIGDLKRRIEELEDMAEVRKAQNDDFRVTLLCVLKAIKQVESQFGVRFMAKGDFYGIKFG